MVGEVEAAAPSMVVEEEGGVMTAAEAALLRLATSLTGMIGVSGVSVLLTPAGRRRRKKTFQIRLNMQVTDYRLVKITHRLGK